MDKYIREDDANDDLGVYSQENYPNMSITRFRHQELNVQGPKSEQESLYGQKLDSLSKQERRLLDLIMNERSIRDAARIMNIKQQTAQQYWERIKEKMQ